MSTIDHQTFLKKLRVNTCLNPLSQSSRMAQIKLSKLIYNNRHIRNISRFLRQEEEILRKSKEVTEEKRVVTETNQRKGRYDENQLKELSYQFESIKAKYVVDMDNKVYNYVSLNGNQLTNRRKESIRKKPTEISKLALVRKPTTFAHHSALPFGNRMRNISLSSQKDKQSTAIKEPFSPLRLKNRVNNNPQVQEIKISLKDQELNSAVNNILKLANKKEGHDYAIPRQFIYHQIEERYKLKNILKQKSSDSPAAGLLMAIVSNSKQQNHVPFRIQLPHCQFVSLKDGKKSIDRIFNMSVKAAQRIAFKIYDRNDNGIIDEKDIIELFTVAQDFPAMQEDMEIIVKNYKINPALKINQGVNQRKSGKFPRKLMTLGQESEYSLDKLNRIEQKAEQVQCESHKFNKEIFFTFKETKKQFFKKKVQNSAAIELTWGDFQLAFKNKRPRIYYDLLDYLFNINASQIYERASRQAYQQDKKSYRIMVFNNSDGKSEVGSNYRIDSQEATRIQKKKPVAGSGSSKKEQKNKAERSSQLMNVQKLIGRVKSINQFESVKYF